jgi:UPF0176 protein
VSHILSITAFYHFTPLDEAVLPAFRQELIGYGESHGLQGLVLIAPEGINGTVAGSSEEIHKWKDYLTVRFDGITFKDSAAAHIVFRKWSVKIKREIVGLGKPDVRPSGKYKHLSPAQWQQVLEQEEVVVLDARNSYEYGIGKFAGAIDCGTTAFHEFPEFVENADLPKDKKILMYCTGGIRCEKALIEMESQGYENVYQLDGGILAYLEQFPHGKFEGECFVFDHRVAVDQTLQPSQAYRTCPHCGNPADQELQCEACKSVQKICSKCITIEHRRTCSKKCANETQCQRRIQATAIAATDSRKIQ